MDDLALTPAATSANPLVPTAAESATAVVALLHVAAWVAAVVWLLRRRNLDTGQRILGLVLATVLPVIGPVIAWWASRDLAAGASTGLVPEQRSDVGNRSANGQR